jgi:hypothetical protein
MLISSFSSSIKSIAIALYATLGINIGALLE